jgi:hypothetical protein
VIQLVYLLVAKPLPLEQICSTLELQISSN